MSFADRLIVDYTRRYGRRTVTLAVLAMREAFPEATREALAFALYDGANFGGVRAALQMSAPEFSDAVIATGRAYYLAVACAPEESLSAQQSLLLRLVEAGPRALKDAQQAGPEQCFSTWACHAGPRLLAPEGASR